MKLWCDSGCRIQIRFINIPIFIGYRAVYGNVFFCTFRFVLVRLLHLGEVHGGKSTRAENLSSLLI